MENRVERTFTWTTRTLLTLGGLVLVGLGAQSCIVSFDANEVNAFSCAGNGDCIAPLTCIKKDGQDEGLCGRRSASNNPVLDCTDNDEDGYGAGVDCKGPDCDDNNAAVNPEAVELCDGIDNDCDCMDDRDNCPLGMIDEVVVCEVDEDCPSSQPEARNGMSCIDGECRFDCVLTEGVCAGATTVCTTTRDDITNAVSGKVVACAISGAYGPDYSSSSEQDEICDGLDNNCNGATDGECQTCDPNAPKSCSTDLGICSQGIRLCEGGMPGECVDAVSMDPVQEPEAETCDGLDNNCDGIVDNAANSSISASVCPDGCPFGMVLVRDPSLPPGSDSWCIDRYEASRADATASSAGADGSRAVSQPGVLPWTGVTIDEALEACRGPVGTTWVRKRLCKQTELTFTCGGVNQDTYPYGSTYDGQTCNTVDAGRASAAPTGPTPADGDADFATCFATRTETEIFDLSGNVAEFAIQNNTARLFGGSYLDAAVNATCTFGENGQGQSGPHIGFRCCYDP